jgi:transposase
MKEEKTFIGIDVSKEKLDVGVRPQADFMTFANTEDGISLLTDFVKSKQPELIVLEATGGWKWLLSDPWLLQSFPQFVSIPDR